MAAPVNAGAALASAWAGYVEHQTMYIVVWTMRDENGMQSDHWEAHETLKEAQAHYADVLENDPYTASIASVVNSTDYAPAER